MRTHTLTRPAPVTAKPSLLRPVPWGRVGWFVLAVVIGMQIGPMGPSNRPIAFVRLAVAKSQKDRAARSAPAGLY